MTSEAANVVTHNGCNADVGLYYELLCEDATTAWIKHYLSTNTGCVGAPESWQKREAATCIAKTGVDAGKYEKDAFNCADATPAGYQLQQAWTKCDGTALSTGAVANPQACADLCTAEGTCVYWTHNLITTDCSLYIGSECATTAAETYTFIYAKNV